VNNTTLLHYAITKDDHDSVEVLLASGVDVNVRDSKGFTPLHVAAELCVFVILFLTYCRGNTRIILALLAEDTIDTNSLSNSGATPFHYFCSRFASPSSLRRVRKQFDLCLFAVDF
jgi:ankyrin repeat protein